MPFIDGAALPIKTPIIAKTTINSTNVNPEFRQK
jgi:hypothetical protein